MSCYLPTSWVIEYPEQDAKHEKHQRSKLIIAHFNGYYTTVRPAVPMFRRKHGQKGQALQHCKETSLSSIAAPNPSEQQQVLRFQGGLRFGSRRTKGLLSMLAPWQICIVWCCQNHRALWVVFNTWSF